MSLSLTSPQFQVGDAIPAKHTCDGEGVSPALEWTDPPEGTVTFALIMEDPDVPLGTLTQWLIWNIPPDLLQLPEAVAGAKVLTALGEAHQGHNDFGHTGYGGPCPPPGPAHRYVFKFFALDRKLSVEPNARRMQLQAAIKGHVLAECELMGSYQRATK